MPGGDMNSPSRTRSPLQIGAIAIVGVLLAGAVAVAVVAGISATNVGKTEPSTEQSAPLVLTVLDRTPTPADALPLDLQESASGFGESGIDLASTRLLASDDAGSYWAAAGNGGEVCIVIVLPTEGVGSACTAVENFVAHGVSNTIHISATDEYAEAYLLPDGVSTETGVDELVPLTSNLLVGDTRMLKTKERSITLSKADGTPWELNVIS